MHLENPYVIALAGPSGSGKTSLTVRLCHLMPTYLEQADENPHLEALLSGRADFDALANQQWFLERMKAAIDRADRNSPLALDQNPMAIVGVYGELFRSAGLIDNAGFEKLESMLRGILLSLNQWPGGFHTIHLDALPEILHGRVVDRQRGVKEPPMDWYEELRIRFSKLLSQIQNCETINTSFLDKEEVFSKVSEILGRINSRRVK